MLWVKLVMLQGQYNCLYRYGSVECNILTDVSEKNKGISVRLAEHLQIFYKMRFICNDKRINENNTYNEGGTGRCEMNCHKCFIERSKYYESDKSSRLFEFPCSFNILCNRYRISSNKSSWPLSNLQNCEVRSLLKSATN